MTLLTTCLLVTGIYSVVMSLVVNTRGFLGAILFKVMPFISGTTLLFLLLSELGYLVKV